MRNQQKAQRAFYELTRHVVCHDLRSDLAVVGDKGRAWYLKHMLERCKASLARDVADSIIKGGGIRVDADELSKGVVSLSIDIPKCTFEVVSKLETEYKDRFTMQKTCIGKLQQQVDDLEVSIYDFCNAPWYERLCRAWKKVV